MSQVARIVEPVEAAAWNPWRALRARPHLRLLFADVPADAGGEMIVDDGRQRTIYLDHTCSRRDRNALLAHALVHDERLLYLPDTPAGIVEREEELVTRETARRLVPLELLGELVDQIVGLDEPVRAVDVMEHFDVPLDVAHKAMWLLEQSRRG